MASFQAKIVWKRPRKRENKNYRFVPFLPDVLQRIPKKIKKIPLWLHLRPEQVGKGREGKKINLIVQFRSYPTRNRKQQKNSKIPLSLHFKTPQVEGG